jgi:hypothetical protein
MHSERMGRHQAAGVDIERVEFIDHVQGSTYAWAVTGMPKWQPSSAKHQVTVEVHVECGRREVLGADVVGADLHPDVEYDVVQAAMAAQQDRDILSRWERAA